MNPDAKAKPRPVLPAANLLQQLPKAALTGLVCECAANGDIEGIRQLVQAGASANEGTPYDLRTPLHLASAAGNLAMAQFLIDDCGATLQRDRFGLLPIHDATQNGHTEVRRYLQSQPLEQAPTIDRLRSESMDTTIKTDMSRHPTEYDLAQADRQDLLSTVFDLVVKEGVFSFTTVHMEVKHFFTGLALHPIYFHHFTAFQIAKHVQCLIAAKHVALATDDVGKLEFALKHEHSGFFLSAIGVDPQNPTHAQKRIEEKVADDLTLQMRSDQCVSLIFMASDGPAFPGGQERLGIYTTENSYFETTKVAENETSLEVLASSRFLKTKTKSSKEQYQIVMEDVVACRRSVVRIVPGSIYPGPHPGGFVVIFGTAETAGRHFLPEICQAIRFAGLSPRRFYFETFANGVITFSLFFPNAREDEVQKLKRTIMASTHLKSFPGRSETVYLNVMQARMPHECGLYLLAAVKFVYAFFPKEQYSREYTGLHQVLEKDPASQRKLETLYKLCMKELLSTERIYDLVQRHLDLAIRFYEDFKNIATGKEEPHYNESIGEAVDQACVEPQDRQILRMFLTFNSSLLLTNFFKPDTPGAFAFRLNPAVVLKERPASLYPEIPYAIYLVCGRDFMGFHTRFRDVARGGIRIVMSRDKATYERNFATLFDECYNLALTQQNKNKDIPEGGAKGVILPDSSWPEAAKNGNGGNQLLLAKKPSGDAPARGNVLAGNSTQSPAATRSCFTRYLNALLDCMLPEQSGIFSGHMKGHPELLYFGPDENTAGYMDMGAELAHSRGYPYWKALTTGKSVKLGGVPHDTYGMTTASVHTYVTELLRELGEDESTITKFQTGGPDGDLGSNEILISKDKTIGIVDGSGVLYDPEGLYRDELTRLARKRAPIKEFSRSHLGPKGFMVTVDETDITLPDGSQWRTGAELRDVFHLTDYATADLFVPCGGRPNAVTTDTVKQLFGEGGRPKFRMVVEGANLFMSDSARAILEKAGVHVFKDASTNKGGVNSSSLEVLAALALTPEEHQLVMCYDPVSGGSPPGFYQQYVQQIKETIIENARQEFKAIWAHNQKTGTPKIEVTARLSGKINRMQDAIQENFKEMSDAERDTLIRTVLKKAVPATLIERLGLEGIIKNVPKNYIAAIVGAWVASRFVYRNGIDGSEVSFYFFLKSLLSSAGDAAANGEA